MPLDWQPHLARAPLADAANYTRIRVGPLRPAAATKLSARSRAASAGKPQPSTTRSRRSCPTFRRRSSTSSTSATPSTSAISLEWVAKETLAGRIQQRHREVDLGRRGQRTQGPQHLGQEARAAIEKMVKEQKSTMFNGQEDPLELCPTTQATRSTR